MLFVASRHTPIGRTDGCCIHGWDLGMLDSVVLRQMEWRFFGEVNGFTFNYTSPAVAYSVAVGALTAENQSEAWVGSNPIEFSL